MSFAIDANILVYASDHHSEFHDKALAFLHHAATGTEPFYLAWPTVMAYLRLVTHRGIMRQPMSERDAQRNISRLLASPACRTLTEDEAFWQRYCEVTREVPATGSFVSDAHLAALLAQNEITTIYTNDRDFRKFDFLETKNPLQ